MLGRARHDEKMTEIPDQVRNDGKIAGRARDDEILKQVQHDE